MLFFKISKITGILPGRTREYELAEMELFRQVVKKKTLLDFSQKKGNLFEYIEAMKFNQKAANAGAGTRAIVTDTVGRPHDSADIELVNRAGNVIRKVQAKVTDTHSPSGTPNGAASGAFYQAGGQKGHWGKYHDMERLIQKNPAYDTDPATGQDRSLLEAAKTLVKKRGQMRGEHAAEYEDVSRNLTDELTDETTGLSSGGTTIEELKKANDDPLEYANAVNMEQSLREIGSRTRDGAVMGAMMGLQSKACSVLRAPWGFAIY